MPSDGFPYPIFTYTALLPWNLFAGALTRSSDSLVSQAGLITKVYFPRLIVPLAASIACGVDFALAFIILIGMMAWYAIVPGWGLIALPFFTLLAITAAFSIGLWLSALNVRYRDVGHALPFIVQVWVFVSPVAYPTSAVSENWRWVYGLNPMAAVIDGFRWALLDSTLPDLTVVLASGLIVAGLLFGGLVFFKRMERSFADVV
jgi:lipopolysaccharide transport system permease protein